MMSKEPKEQMDCVHGAVADKGMSVPGNRVQ